MIKSDRNRRKDRILAAALAVGIVLLNVAAAESGVSHVETIEREIESGEARVIVIEGINGNISVTGEDGRSGIYLKVVKTAYTEDEDQARKIASLMEVEISRKDDILRIEALFPKKFKTKRSLLSMVIDKHPKMTMEMTLVVPKGFEAVATTANGSVILTDIGANATVSVSNGNANLKNIDGDIEVSVTSGKIEAVKISGNAVLKVTNGMIIAKNIGGDVHSGLTSGKIKLLRIGGNLAADIGYGSIVVDGVGGIEYRGVNAEADFIDVRGSVDASTASGDILLRAVPEGDNNYKITSSSGEIVLRFLEIMEGGYVLKVGTTSGTINVDLPLDLKKVARNSIYGIVRGGKTKVFLESASGDITIEEPGE
ncbi:MAG: DUF4097 family beta strand repeat protein [Candidatus Krumholzibacteriota bacterium]|nr:DUF4097 family beta strand repeat protein [Candidatus Krumholzibacteriota bacterium]